MPRSEHERRPIDELAYPAALERAECPLIVERRQNAGFAPEDCPTNHLPDDAVGVGLSGGGIRSATFSLGIFQALAFRDCLERVDFLSTVSGGGYFGSFLGRLFTREWVRGVDDVKKVLLAAEPSPGAHQGVEAWPAKVFRWLRENGRFLAPRGSGDVLLLGAILLRNWLSVQLVLVVTALAVFGTLQIARIGIEQMLVAAAPAFDTINFLACSLPLGNSLLWWSPLLVVPLIPLLLVVAPSSWAYWLVSRDDDGVRGIPAWVAALLALVLSAWGAQHYLTAPAAHPARLVSCLVVGGLAALSLIFYLVGEIVVRWIAPQPGASVTETGNRLRASLNRAVKNGVTAVAVLFGAAVIDSIGETIYAVSQSGDLARWGAAVFGVFAAVGAFARPALLLFAPTRPSVRPGLITSIVSWVAAVVVALVWLVSVDIGSHAMRWGLHQAQGVPAGLRAEQPVPILGADALVIRGGGDGAQTVTARVDAPPSCVPLALVSPVPTPFLTAGTVVLWMFALLFGQTRRFANLSSIHGFYTDQLTRTFLGASNDGRLDKELARRHRNSASITTKGDDCGGARYWNWPVPPGFRYSPEVQAARVKARPWDKGGPLHIINATVNESVDGRTGVQNRDRKGIALAVGPTALSLGIRHHLVARKAGWLVFPSVPGEHKVFQADSKVPPEPLSLGRWMSISGAAFTAAAGANTTVPLAFLCGMFNVRLGYWWNSETGFGDRRLERFFPVQSAFLSEMLARTHGTSGRLWNLSDGGHFENMAGYELIRRRLPIIIIIDAEADPDYTFQGLSDLVRKARLDFRSEVVFLSSSELGGSAEAGDGPLPASVRPYFGDLDALRRGRWTTEDVASVSGEPGRRYTLEVERSHPSKAHAALARVIHGDPGATDAPRSWLVYVKATLMGDEPEDVCHYHRGHPDFPQETTLDQFFDEAQWESYRRLGQHVGNRVLTRELFDHLKAHPA